MNDTKEKSAVGAATPATERDINISSENIISGNEEKIKGQSYENMTAILDSLSDTLRLTHAGKNIESIVPVTSLQTGIYAIVTYNDGRTTNICIDGDSGIAAVYDVAKALLYS